MNIKNKKFQRGSQKAFLGMFVALILVLFLFLGFVKNVTLNNLEKNILTDFRGSSSYSDNDIVDIVVSGVKIKAEVAKSKDKKAKGLSDRESIESSSAMLFVFDKPGFYTFWNKDTLIELDILWIKDNKIVYIFKNLPIFKEGSPLSVIPDSRANFVLELNAGFIEKNNIKIGDEVIIKK